MTAPGPFAPSSWCTVGAGFARISDILVDLAVESKPQVMVRGVWDICRVPEGWRVLLAGMSDERYEQGRLGSIPRDPRETWRTQTL